MHLANERWIELSVAEWNTAAGRKARHTSVTRAARWDSEIRYDRQTNQIYALIWAPGGQAGNQLFD